MPEFQIRLAADDLVFSAAHFLVGGRSGCESLHGHDYRVVLEAFGPLDENRCVLDFLAARDALKTVLAALDHRVLLPEKHERLQLRMLENRIELSCGERSWSLPAADCRLLPIADTSCELLAEYICRRLLETLSTAGRGRKNLTLKIEVSEGSGCSAACRLP